MTATVKTEKATVAVGRSLRTQAGKVIGPGSEVELPVEDVKALRARGFLTNPNPKTPEVKRGIGPEFGASQARRPTVTRVG